jgi:hypothetical protein
MKKTLLLIVVLLMAANIVIAKDYEYGTVTSVDGLVNVAKEVKDEAETLRLATQKPVYSLLAWCVCKKNRGLILWVAGYNLQPDRVVLMLRKISRKSECGGSNSNVAMRTITSGDMGYIR